MLQSRGRKESDKTERLNNNSSKTTVNHAKIARSVLKIFELSY